jgi:hypothetical protein
MPADAAALCLSEDVFILPLKPAIVNTKRYVPVIPGPFFYDISNAFFYLTKLFFFVHI